jgi:hypothetical protein
MTGRRPSLPEPVMVARFWANRRGEAIFVQLREFEGRALVDVRKHFTAKDGTMQPTKKGISIMVTRLPELAAALTKAAAKAVELGLLEGEARP